MFMYGLIQFAFFAFILYAIVHMLYRPKKEGDGLTLEQIKRGAVVVSLSILVIIFVIFFARSLVVSGDDTMIFIIELVLSLLILGAGYGARRNAVVSNGLIIGGFFTLVYSISVNFYTFSQEVKTLVVGVSLLVATLFAYWYGLKRDESNPKHSQLHGFKAVVIGSLIVIFASLFITNLNQAINPAPAYPNLSYPSEPPRYYQYKYNDSGRNSSSNFYTDSQNYSFSDNEIKSFQDYDASKSNYDSRYREAMRDYDEKKAAADTRSAYIVILIAFAYLAIGLLVHGVPTVSIAYIVAGVGGILYVFIESFDSLSRTAVTILSGIGIVALVAFAYWKFGNEPHNLKEQSSPNTDQQLPPLS